MKTKVSIAEAYAKGLGQVKMPMVINSSSGNSAPSDALKTFFDLKTAALALEMSENQKTK